MSLFDSRSDASDLFRPFLWLALFAFLVGFSGYLALGAGHMPAPHARSLTPVSAPVVAWSGTKAI